MKLNGQDNTARFFSKTLRGAFPAKKNAAVCLLAGLVVLQMSEIRGMGQDSIDVLVTRLRGMDPEIQDAAATTLRHLGPKAAGAVPALIEALGDHNDATRCHAADCLGHIGSLAKAAIPTLAGMLRNQTEEENVRSEAALALGRIGPDALNVLLDLLQSGPDTIARSEAANAIGKMGPKAEPAIPKLVAALAEREYWIWNCAGESLAEIGLAAVPALRDAVQSDNPRVRVHAGQVLLQLESSHLPTIRAMIRDLGHREFEVRRDAVLALESASPASVSGFVLPLAKALKDEDVFVRKTAAHTLSQVGPEAHAAIPALIEVMRDPEFEVRGYSALALGNIRLGSKAVIDALIEGLDDQDDDVRILVVRALGTIGPAARPSVPKLKAALEDTKLHGELRPVIEKAISAILKDG